MVTIRSANQKPDTKAEWGTLTWLCDQRSDPDAQMTFGVAKIEVGKQNPRHYHPNCEEHIFIVSGQCDHKVAGETIAMRAGDMIRVPEGVAHEAVNTGQEQLVMVIVYSDPDRQVVGEDDEVAEATQAAT